MLREPDDRLGVTMKAAPGNLLEGGVRLLQRRVPLPEGGVRLLQRRMPLIEGGVRLLQRRMPLAEGGVLPPEGLRVLLQRSEPC